METGNTFKIAAVGDIHIKESDMGKYTAYFKEVAANADVLLICGDLTDTGDEAEAAILAAELQICPIPVICVLGNHDYDKGREKFIKQTLQSSRVHVLDGEAVIIGHIGFAGVKGFGGGFNNNMLTLFGEPAAKAFVQDAVNEALRLENALAVLDANPLVHYKIVLTHYAPIPATVAGEPAELYPFLGSSRLEGPMVRNRVTAVFHGHAHNGTLKGKINNDIKVFNVAAPVLLAAGYPVPYYLFKIEI